ncbi:MAG: alpha/beta hydrolase [Mitsuaria chitosanitabida]|uniref:alpha/beta fold hydrolase n=1 Tax=Roseateles chitosanitabidus TaxID=65048 RepID=UPI001B2D8785|nr:alpha/beta hydrolase [Roseateles chitosanitabidus]MBO9689214.1 alpha/beta hydrolase [Roseateles chitosanitabidus]
MSSNERRPGALMSWPSPRLIALAAVCAAAALTAGCGSVMPNTGNQRVVGGPIVYTKVGHGEPTIVLQSGLGDGRDPWAPVLGQLREHYSVFAYDRPGYGESTATPPIPRSPCGIASELHELLKSAGVKPPYVLVGHSIGGLYQYAYSRLYPDEVAGIVLVDATHPMHLRRMQVEVPLMANMLESMSRRVFRGMMQVEFNMQQECVDALLQKPRPEVPVRVLTRTVYSPVEAASGFESMVHGLEPNWLPLVGGKGLQPVPGAGHYIQRDKPEVVVAAIEAVTQEARKREAEKAATAERAVEAPRAVATAASAASAVRR